MVEQTARFIAQNASTIFRVIGGVTGIATPFLAIRADRKANSALIILDMESSEPITKKDAIKAVWKYYIPPVATGITSIGCNIAASNIDNQCIHLCAGALAESVDISEKVKSATIATLGGIEAYRNIEDTIKKNTYISETSSENMDLFWDTYQKKFFYAEKSDVLEAIQLYAKLYNKRGFASINDFYKTLNNPQIEPCASGELEGYNKFSEYCDVNGMDGTDLISIRKVTLPDVAEHYEISFAWDPLYDYMEKDMPI